MKYQFTLILQIEIFNHRQCDNSVSDIFDDNTNSASSGQTDELLTGSQLVRKYVTFHFYFPVGNHHPPLGTPLLSHENGLLQYQANCDKVI